MKHPWKEEIVLEKEGTKQEQPENRLPGSVQDKHKTQTDRLKSWVTLNKETVDNSKIASFIDLLQVDND